MKFPSDDHEGEGVANEADPANQRDEDAVENQVELHPRRQRMGK